MRKSRTPRTIRRYIGLAAAGMAAAAAVAAPGIAWANDPIADGPAISVPARSLDSQDCGPAQEIHITKDKLRQMIADGTAVPAMPAAPDAITTVPAPGALPVVIGSTSTTHADIPMPEGAITVTRDC